jgi:energy-coupling factor transport system ATP-binding protein
VSFELEPGACLLVVGPSGSGKSTLALALAGLVPGQITGEWRGRLEVDGEAPGPATASTGSVGLVFQDPDRQLVMERVEDDVAFGLENRGWSLETMRLRVPEALAEVGLAGFERRRPTHLSGGEQQRLALAGVLAPRPGLLVLDEPTANLDPGGADALIDRLAALRERRAATIVLIEHDVDRAWPLADRVLALGSDGAPIDVGAPAEVLRRSADVMRRAGIWLPGETREVRPSPPPDPETTPAAKPLVEAQRVSFAFDPSAQPVVVDVSMRVGAGERLALVGPNGGGKSTLGRLLVGLLRPASGRVRLGEASPADLPPAELARRAGYVFQDPERQFLARTVGEEVRLGLREDELRSANDLMDSLGLPLERFGERSPYALSGGEQRRLSLACILVRRPGLLVLDEPTFGQDRNGHEGLLANLRDRVDEGAAVLAATHDRRFVRDFATRIIAMEGGRVVSPDGGPE